MFYFVLTVGGLGDYNKHVNPNPWYSSKLVVFQACSKRGRGVNLGSQETGSGRLGIVNPR